MTFSDKYTIVFDGNHFLHKTMHVVSKIVEQEGRIFNLIDDPAADKNTLLWKLSMDFASEIKKFTDISENVVYCIDSGSWRKQYFTEEHLDSNPDDKYKGTREYKNDFSWDKLYEAHTEFTKALEKSGIKVVKIQGCEADDLIFAWSTYLNSKGKNCLIISGDNDMLQLVNHDNSNGTNTIYYHKNKQKIFASNGFKSWLERESSSIDIFNQPISLADNTKQNLRGALKQFEIEELNSEEFQFTKILVGDSGDNVKALYTTEMTYKSGKKAGEKWYKSLDSTQSYKILQEFKTLVNEPIQESMFWNPEYVLAICKIAKKVCKLAHMETETLVKNYEDNRNLMILNVRSLPSGIMDSMLESISKLHTKNIPESNMKTLRSYEKILEGTTYSEKTKKKQNSAGFFGGFDLD